MSDVPQGLRYTEEHEYLKETETSGEYLVGVTDYAQSELGDVVFLELPSPGDRFDRMEVFGTIEAVKAVSDLYCPVAGEVVETNEALEDDPALVNDDPYGDGWMVRLAVDDEADVDDLLTHTGYEEHIEA